MLRFHKVPCFFICTKLHSASQGLHTTALPYFSEAHFRRFRRRISCGIAHTNTMCDWNFMPCCCCQARLSSPSPPFSPRAFSKKELSSPPTHSPSRSWVSSPSPPRRSSSWLPFAPVPPSFSSVSDVKTHEGQREWRPYPCPRVNEEENRRNACQLERFRLCT